MIQIKSRVSENKEISEGYFRLSIDCKEVADRALSGQFAMVRVGDSYDPLLRRPFSLHKIIKGQGIEVLYKVIGKGTGMMAHIKPGEIVDVIGPLGRGFWFDEELEEAIVVGGGIGAAPLLALTQDLSDRKVKKIVVFLGGRNKRDILCLDEFERLGADVHIATDDGSYGYKGFVTELLDKYLSGRVSCIDPNACRRVAQVYSCGPHMMSHKVAGISKKHKVPCQVSLEAHMACGVGACLGCVIKVHGRGGVTPPLQPATGCGCDSESVPCDTQVSDISYKRVCMEGPVFDAEEVVWD